MIVRKVEPYTEYTKLDRNVFSDKTISDGAARLYAYLSGLKTGGQFKDTYIMKCLGISQPSLTRRKSELKKKDLILIDRVGLKQYFLYIGNTKFPASRVKAHWDKEEALLMEDDEDNKSNVTPINKEA